VKVIKPMVMFIKTMGVSYSHETPPLHFLRLPLRACHHHRFNPHPFRPLQLLHLDLLRIT
jgi:hypothetical protein